MRIINQKGYYQEAYLFSKNFDTGTYETIPKLFLCKEVNTTHQSTNHVGMMTDTTTKIETLSELTFQVGDRVTINGGETEIIDVTYEPYKDISKVRGIAHYKKVITLP